MDNFKYYCDEIKKRTKTKYTDEEVEKIVNFLYSLAQMEYEQFLKKQNNEKSSFDVSCIQRRAS